MQIHSTSAIVLRAVAYGEADRIVTFLGRTTGIVAAMARGARKSQRRFPGLDLGVVGEARLKERPGADLALLESFDVAGPQPNLGEDVGTMAHGAYVAELVSRLCAPRQPEVAVFDWLLVFLQDLRGSGPSAEGLRVFELGLLQRLGMGPALAACASCGRRDLPENDEPGVTSSVRWSPDRGGVVCAACRGNGRPLPAAVRRALVMLAQAARSPLPPDVNRACREALAEVFALHLHGPLRSLEFLHKMEAARR